MILTVAVLLFQFPAVAGPSNSVGANVRQPFVSASTASTAPSAPVANPASDSGNGSAKLASSSVPAPVSPSKSTSTSTTSPSPAPIQPTTPDLNIFLPLPRTFQPEAAPILRPSRTFFFLAAAEHSAAGFDAWSTRQAVAQGRYEADPLMRPFAHSGAIYGAIQVVPLGLDFLARRMQRSSGWSRHLWWLPQSAATATFLFSGSYNAAHTR